MRHRTAASVAALLLPLALSACISTTGRVEPNTQFVFPNSNVTRLGPVSASIEKRGPLIFVPKLSAEEILGVYDEALAQEEGATLLVNFEEETTVSNFLIFNTIRYSLNGTAASMEVGEQELR